ncbi:hypothetical protein [Paenibacillus sp. y28]
MTAFALETVMNVREMAESISMRAFRTGCWELRAELRGAGE